MPDFRVHAAPPLPGEPTLLLDAAESHHLLRVNRARTGDPVTAFDGHGTEWLCELAPPEGKLARLRIRSSRTAPPLPSRLLLAQALPKGGVMDDIVRQATELGVATLHPLTTERTELHLEPDRAARKLDKWRLAATEAAKQCGNPWLPHLAPVQPLPAFLARPELPACELRLLASLQPGAPPLRTTLDAFRSTHGRPPASAAGLIGPEGDFSPAETAAILAAGWTPVSLGPLVLRCDTAATYLLSVLRCESTLVPPPTQ